MGLFLLLCSKITVVETDIVGYNDADIVIMCAV
nr:MAG TPA: hypothetical protein [Caudoviricetes sp.]